MYPSLVAADSGVVRALVAASEQALGIAPADLLCSNAFDQGYLNHIGIEACTYGPGDEQLRPHRPRYASVDRTRGRRQGLCRSDRAAASREGDDVPFCLLIARIPEKIPQPQAAKENFMHEVTASIGTSRKA